MMNETQNILKHSEQVLHGKEDKIKLALCAIFSKGHVLIEDVPGVGKTTMAKALGRLLDLEVSRIQFTNDLLPSDIIGSSIYDRNSQQFIFHHGPLFGELILADELNRAPAKTQSALLQAMEEKVISVEGNNYKLSPYFTVFATQNPHSQIGTHDLPESQLDRFTMKFTLGYPGLEDSIEMLKTKSTTKQVDHIPKVLSKSKILEIQNQIESIHFDDDLYDFIYRLLSYSRNNQKFIPLSNRCGIDLVRTAKAWAYLQNRDYVICDDIQYIFPFVAGHRLVHPASASIRNENDLSLNIIQNVPIRK